MMSFISAFEQEIGRIVRTPLDLALLTLMPFMLLGAMAAMLFEGTPHHLPVVIVDRDGGSIARELARNVAMSPSLAVVARTSVLDEAMTMVRSERAVAILVIPRGVGTRVAGRAPVEIFYQAVFLSTGTLASTSLRIVTEATLLGETVRSAGLEGVTILHTALPGAQVSLLGNPALGFEWYLGLLLGPAILHLLIAVTCVGSSGLLLRDRTFAHFAAETAEPAFVLAGRIAPHVLSGTLWGALWLLWLTLARGYHAQGSLFLIVLALFLLFVATAAIALLLLAVTGEVATSLSALVIIAGSALAYSGASLPITGSGWFVRGWSQVLPLTHYIELQMDVVLGADPQPLARAVGALLLYPLIAGTSVLLLLRRSVRRQA